MSHAWGALEPKHAGDAGSHKQEQFTQKRYDQKMGLAFPECEGLGSSPVVPQEGVPLCVVSHLLVQSGQTSSNRLLYEGFLYLYGEVYHKEPIAKPLGSKGSPENRRAMQAEHEGAGVVCSRSDPTYPKTRGLLRGVYPTTIQFMHFSQPQSHMFPQHLLLQYLNAIQPCEEP